MIKKFLPRTLFGRSLLILVTPVLLIQIITAVVFFDRHWGRVTSRLAYAVAGEVSSLANTIELTGYNSDSWSLQRRNAAVYLGLDVRFKPGAEMPSSDELKGGFIWNSLVTETLTKEMRRLLRRPFVVSSDFDEKWVIVSAQLTNGVLQVTLPSSRLFSSSSYIFLLWMIGASSLLLFAAVIFMRNQIRPIRKLAVAADRFGKGREIGMFRPSGAREVRQASQAFIDMQSRIKRQIQQRTAMLAGVSHDLRTPLTRMTLQTEMMPDGEDKIAMKSDISDMERMINGYLDFVRGDGDEDMVSVDMINMLSDICNQARRQDISISCTFPQDEEVRLFVRPVAMKRCLLNFINNAGKYAYHVWMSLSMDDPSAVEIILDDDGPGIPLENREDVFRPFYRLDSSRNAQTGGVGLGLSIAADIVHSHGGQIILEDSLKTGLRVRIILPR